MKKWIFRNHTGQIYGPFNKEKIEELLMFSRLTGEEEVAEYPTGDWKVFSHEPELADILLKTISQSGLKQKEAPYTPQEKIVTKKIESKIIKNVKNQSKTNNTTSRTLPPNTVIELTEEKKIKRKTNYIPLVILLFAVAIIVYGFQKKSTNKFTSINLIMPQFKIQSDPVKSQELLKQGWTYFYKDTFKNYIKAQEYFVKSAEESSQNADALIMLLMTQLELWPFAKQDSLDQEVVKSILQQVTKVDPYGGKRLLANAIGDSILTTDSINRSQIDSGLQQQPTEARFYYLKALNFYNFSEFEQAINYYDKTATLLNYWAKPLYQIGLSFARLGNGAKAQEYFQRALALNPQHIGAQLELGILEESFYNHSEKAMERINSALLSHDKVLQSREAKARYWLAVIYQKKSDIKNAKIEAEKAYSLLPTDIAIAELLSKLGGQIDKMPKASNEKEYISYGDQYMRLKNYLGAQAQYKAAFELNPKSAQAAHKAAEALYKLSQTQEAIKYLDKAILADPKFISAYIKLSEIKTLRFDFEGAAKVLEQALKQNPKSFEIYKAYGFYFLKRGDFLSAENFTTRALQIYESDSGLNQLMSQIYLGKKDFVKALQYAKRALTLDYRNVDAQTNFSKVKAQYESVKAAAEYLKDLINTYPSELNYRMALAEILIQDEQFTAAEQVLNQVLAFDNNQKEAHQLLGDSYFLNNKYNESLQAYFNVTRIDPSDAGGIFRAGEVYSKTGKYNEAAKQFQLVIKINPLFPRTHYNLAKVYFNLGQAEQALSELNFEKKLNPRLADPYELSGDIYLATRKFAKATQEYQKAAELKPQGAMIFVKQAKAYRAQHSLDAASAMLRLAIAKESGFAEIYKEQGLIYEQKGQAEEAVISFKQYLKLDPNAPDKEQILDKIKALEE